MQPYITSSDPKLTSYLQARGLMDEWNVIADKDAALVNGSDYIDLRFRKKVPSGWVSMFSGVKSGGRSQYREWPRDNAVDYYGYSIPDGTIPDEVVYATIEAALREGKNPGGLIPDWQPTYTPDGTGPIKSEKEGDLSHEFMSPKDMRPDEGDSGVTGNMPAIPEIRRIMAPLLTGPGATAYSSSIGMRLVT